VITTVLAIVVVFGVSIFVHEIGHFAAAKLAGIRVLRLSLGFGKVLFRVTWRGTEYAVSLLPLGGYVKMAGGDERESEGKADEFLTQPPWVRMVVAFAGPAMNFVVAVLLFAAAAKVGYTVYTPPNRVGEVLDTVTVDGEEVATPARLAGFKEGDDIVAVDGESAPYWIDLQRVTFLNAGKRLTFDVRRDGRMITLQAEPVLVPETGRGMLGLAAYQSNDVNYVLDGSLAFQAGVAPGDKLTAFDGRPVAGGGELADLLEDLRPGRHEVTFTSHGLPKVVGVDYEDEDLEAFFEDLGVVPGIIEVKRSESWRRALPAGWERTWEVLRGTARGLVLVFTARVKVTKALGGPITIARYAGETARAGFAPYLEFVALISVMVAMLNLLPVPVLDGGHIAIGAVETVRRRNISAGTREKLALIGYAFIFGLILLVLFVDLARWSASRGG
jgi:regulator of sigma E protease